MPIESIIVDLRELDWELLESTDGLSDQRVLELAGDFVLEQFSNMGTQAQLAFLPDWHLKISWDEPIDTGKVIEHSNQLLELGRHIQAASCLWTLLRVGSLPNEHFIEGTYLLGSAYNLMQRYQEATAVLEVTLKCDPEHYLAMSGLGFAELAAGNRNLAEEWFRKSLAIEPNNSWALKNLGICLTNERRFSEAVIELRRCLDLAPSDQAVLVGLGQCLHHLGQISEAKRCFEQAVSLGGTGKTAGVARDYLDKYQRDEAKPETELNQTAVNYLVDAIERLSGMETALKKAAIMEIVLLAAKGLAINDPSTKHKLKALDGEFTGLYLACFMYAAVQEVAPGQDVGVDFSREYQKAKS